jgi:hypothetical protein
MKSKHLGGDFDDFLREQDMLAGAEAVATKRVLAFQLEKEMRRKGLTKVEMATRMRTSDSRGPSAGPGEYLGHVEYAGEGRTCAREEVEHQARIKYGETYSGRVY